MRSAPSYDNEDNLSSTPPWMLTFGDLMALLLTFFVLLVSMSEMKRDDRFQGIADSLGERFGSFASGAATSLRPRHLGLAAVLRAGREERQAALGGGLESERRFAKHVASPGDRAGGRIDRLGIVRFAADDWELNDRQRDELRRWLSPLAAEPGVIELRCPTGASDRATTSADAVVPDACDLAYLRCRRVRQFLIEEFSLAPEKLLVTIGTDVGKDDPSSTAGRLELWQRIDAAAAERR